MFVPNYRGTDEADTPHTSKQSNETARPDLIVRLLRCRTLCMSSYTVHKVFLLGAPEGTEAPDDPDDTPLLEVDPEPVEPDAPTDDASYLGCFSDPAASRVFLEAESSTASEMSAEVRQHS